MDELLIKLSRCVELGKIDKVSPYPPDMKGQEGADELTRTALEQGIKPDDILEKSLIPAMASVGERFSRKEIYVPQMLMAAKAMNGAMKHIKPYFQSGETKRKGKFIIGTVAGDLHDIGKNLVAMMMEGQGLEIIDAGTDVAPERFVELAKENDAQIIACSALLTTTMGEMKSVIEAATAAGIRENVVIMVGGAPVNDTFAKTIGADIYTPDAASAAEEAIAALKAKGIA